MRQDIFNKETARTALGEKITDDPMFYLSVFFLHFP